ncbi:MAG: hypothetical protein CMJ49_08020 [Planctomycetaceae bacterium]|nr:hypothetical protein [Planctomycetaceae bacterium]
MPGWTYEGSDHVVAGEAVVVGGERQLLMDSWVVADTAGCQRVVHQPVRHEANPLIVAGPEGGKCIGHANVIHDAARGVYQMWTEGAIMRGSRAGRTHYHQTYGRYFESTDGVDWEAPDLSLFEVEGIEDGNVFLADAERGVSPSVIETPTRWRERGKYLMVYDNGMMGRRDFAALPANGQQQRLAFSDDGIRWQGSAEPIFRGQSDTHNNVCYNEERGVLMLYRRAPINAGEIRRIAYSESADLIDWTQPRVIVSPDELDAHSLYGMTVSRYQGVYIGFLQQFYLADPLGGGMKPGKHMMVDVQLAWSRDGLNWSRHPGRPIFLETGPVGSYDWGMVYVGKGLIERDDRIDLYYTGWNFPHVPGEQRSHICLAALRKDGFVSVGAPERGRLLTRPMVCPGGRLHVNLRAQEGGGARVQVMRGDGAMDGHAVEGWGNELSGAVTGDVLDEVVGWGGSAEMGAMKGRTIRLLFEMERAEIYSFWFGT